MVTSEISFKVKVAALSNDSGWMRAVGEEVIAVGIWAVEASNLALAASPGQVGELWHVQVKGEEHFGRDVQVMQWPGELPEVENTQTVVSNSVERFLGLVDAGRAVTVLAVKDVDGCTFMKIDVAVEIDHDHAEDYAPWTYLFNASRELEYFDGRGEDASLYEISSQVCLVKGVWSLWSQIMAAKWGMCCAVQFGSLWILSVLKQ